MRICLNDREIQKVYKGQGVDINDKHVEVIIRQMLKKRTIRHPGDSIAFLPGQVVDKFVYEDENTRLREAESLCARSTVRGCRSSRRFEEGFQVGIGNPAILDLVTEGAENALQIGYGVDISPDQSRDVLLQPFAVNSRSTRKGSVFVRRELKSNRHSLFPPISLTIITHSTRARPRSRALRVGYHMCRSASLRDLSVVVGGLARLTADLRFVRRRVTM
jgi:hypothetical protein